MHTIEVKPLLSSSGKVPISDRGRQREAAILRVATKHFLKFGYGNTTLDAIAKEAGGSKSTLYRFFPSKPDLFHAVVTAIVADERRVRLDSKADVFNSLVEFAVERLKVVFSKRHFSLLRLVIAERDRFPRIAETYYSIGPERSHQLLVQYFGELEQEGIITGGDTDSYAHFFTGLLMHDWYIKHLYVTSVFPTAEEQEDRAREVVRAFLKSHLTPNMEAKR